MKCINQWVRVVAPARLHMGFIDISGVLGRRFGSLGVGLNELATRLTVRVANQPSASGPNADRAIQCLRKLSQTLNVPDNLHIAIDEAIPEHVGLGSGTQMSLAIGLALSNLYGLNLSERELARFTDRGARSGIGIAVFERGGFIIDGGRSGETDTPPVIARMEFPSEWSILLVFDTRGKGLHGHNELEAFNRLPPFAKEEVARFCHLLMMQALPALAENNLTSFGDAVTEIQRSIGDYFASMQGGRFTSPEVGVAVEWLGEQGAVGLGQSSWGPTGFCLVKQARADILLNAATQRFKHVSTLRFMIVSARNQGGKISILQPDYSVSTIDREHRVESI